MPSIRVFVPTLLCAALLAAPIGRAEVPFPTCESAGCADPYDYADYLVNDPANVFEAMPEERIPDDFDPDGGDAWRYLPDTGLDIIDTWAFTTGRPDVLVAVLDSGIRWTAEDLILKTALNTDELPVPVGCGAPVSPSQLAHDCNGDGVVNLADFAGQQCQGEDIDDENGNDNGIFDVQDLLLVCSDGVDGLATAGTPVANGYVDDIAGWDFFEDDNDAFDDTDYGHGTGEALDSTGEAHNETGFPGVAPSAMSFPVRVGDSFVATESDFVQGVIYSVDRGASLVQEALGAINQTTIGQAAIDYAYNAGVPVMASAADEESRHHNYPANHDHVIWVNSIRDGDGTIAIESEPKRYDLLNGCTNYGARAWVAISSSSCSSEATGRSSGLTALLVAHGKNLAEAGTIEWFDAARKVPFSAEEVRQLYRAAAEDIDYSDDLSLGIDDLLALALSVTDQGEAFPFQSSRFPTKPGWDQFTGYGRPDGADLLAQVETAIPPEADLAGNLPWFTVLDPERTPKVKIVGSARADRNDGFVDWRLQVGCGVDPDAWTTLDSDTSVVGFENATLTKWKPAATAKACGFKPKKRIEDPDAHTVTLRFIVRDRDGVRGEDRRAYSIHTDKTERFAPRRLAGSGEPPIALADVNRDGVLDLVIATSDGAVRVLDGKKGKELPGFPVYTDLLPVHDSPAWAPAGPVALPHESILGGPAVGDLDRDGTLEIVVASSEGQIYVFDDQGVRATGFPVSTDPALSLPANRDRFNDADPGVAAAPTLADLDGGGTDLEIVIAALDGHVYAWQSDAAPVSGFPVRVGDTDRVTLAPSGMATPLEDSMAKERLTKIIGSPAVGDLDDDGSPEIVVATNEEYGGSDGFFTESSLLGLLLGGTVDLGDFDADVSGRVYALNATGNDAPGGAVRDGWPVPVPMLVSQLLPNVATGTPGSPAIADLDPTDEDDTLVVAIFGTAGPTILLDADGESVLGTGPGGKIAVLDNDFGDGTNPDTNDLAGSIDAPFLPALGSGAFGDLDGDGLPEYVAPTGGVRKLIDVAASGSQTFGDHQVTAWNPRTGKLHGTDPAMPNFPAFMDDMQFINSPAIADVDGDGNAEVVQSSGVYLVRAYRSDGTMPKDWPKFTHGWHIGSPAVGDIDGDGLMEVATVTREGMLHVWDTPAATGESAAPWPTHARDSHNSGNLESGVSTTAASVFWGEGLDWALRSVSASVERLIDDADPALAAELEASDGPEEAAAAALLVGMDDFVDAAAALPGIDKALADPAGAADALAPVQKRFRSDVKRVADLALEQTECGDDDTCKSDRKSARKLLDKARSDAKKGKPGKALKRRAKALGILAGLPTV